MTSIRQFGTALMNGLRRTMLNYVKTYGFVPYLDQEDYQFLSETLGVKHLKEGRPNLTVLVDTTSNVMPVLAHRCARVAIYTSAETETLLNSDEQRKVYFAVCERGTDLSDLTRFSRPLINTKNEGIRVYLRDLEPAVFIDGIYSLEETKKIQDNMTTIFKYNPVLAHLELGNKLNILLKPVLGRGFDDPRWTPCIPRYRFILDPSWPADERPVVNQEDGRANTITRKVKGKLGLKDIFITDPNTREPYDKFGQPYGISLLFEYNGKMSCQDALSRTVDYLIDATHRFLAYYQNDAVNDTDDDETVQVIHKTMQDDTQILHIPMNTQGKLRLNEPESIIFTEHTLANIIRMKILQFLDEVIGNNMDWWSGAAVSYRVPHPQIDQCVIYIPLPLHNADGSPNTEFQQALNEWAQVEDGNDADFHKVLVERACESIIEDLTTIQTLIEAS